MTQSAKDYFKAQAQEKAAAAAAISADANADGRGMTEDERTKASALIDEAQEFHRKAADLDANDKFTQQIENMVGKMTGPPEQAPSHIRSIGEAFVKSDGYRALIDGFKNALAGQPVDDWRRRAPRVRHEGERHRNAVADHPAVGGAGHLAGGRRRPARTDRRRPVDVGHDQLEHGPLPAGDDEHQRRRPRRSRPETSRSRRSRSPRPTNRSARWRRSCRSPTRCSRTKRRSVPTWRTGSACS